ncbi:hypothetical protein Tco_0372649, partial [Tanacetum coccineum]
KVDEPKSSDIYVVRDYIDVFLEDLSGLPPQLQVEFRIELQELSGQLQELSGQELSSALENARNVWATSRVARQRKWISTKRQKTNQKETKQDTGWKSV